MIDLFALSRKRKVKSQKGQEEEEKVYKKLFSLVSAPSSSARLGSNKCQKVAQHLCAQTASAPAAALRESTFN